MVKRKPNKKNRSRRDPVPSRRPRRQKPASPGRGRAARRAGQWIYGAHAVLAALANPRRRWLRLLLTAPAEKTLGERIKNITAAREDESCPGPEITSAKALDELLPAGPVHQGIALEAHDLPQTGIEDIVEPE